MVAHIKLKTLQSDIIITYCTPGLFPRFSINLHRKPFFGFDDHMRTLGQPSSWGPKSSSNLAHVQTILQSHNFYKFVTNILNGRCELRICPPTAGAELVDGFALFLLFALFLVLLVLRLVTRWAVFRPPGLRISPHVCPTVGWRNVEERNALKRRSITEWYCNSITLQRKKKI